jgi:hypothetical protein
MPQKERPNNKHEEFSNAGLLIGIFVYLSDSIRFSPFASLPIPLTRIINHQIKSTIMKKVLVFASIALLAACNSKEPAKTDSMKSGTDTSMTTMRDINSPYPVNYSSKFTMGDPANAESLLNLWKIWDGGDLSAAKNIFADTVEMHLWDGSTMKGPRDSIIAGGQHARSSFATSVSSVDAITALKSTDRNENWALIWGMERDTDKKGKVDSFYLQETWRFNKNGKTDLMYQFKANGTPPKK